MNIIGFRSSGRHAKKDAPPAQTLSTHGGCTGTKGLLQRLQQKPCTDDSNIERHSENIALPPAAERLDSSTQQQRLGLARSEALNCALKWFGTRFVR